MVHEGATPIFVDIDPLTYNLDPAEIARRRTLRTRAVMVVDVFGHPADWDEVERAGADPLLIDDRKRSSPPCSAKSSSACSPIGSRPSAASTCS